MQLPNIRSIPLLEYIVMVRSLTRSKPHTELYMRRVLRHLPFPQPKNFIDLSEAINRSVWALGTSWFLQEFYLTHLHINFSDPHMVKI